MNPMNVELRAVTKIVDMISECSHLEPVIDSNDKTLLTDGHIDVHSSEVHSKETFEGRVVVQVKGRKPIGLESFRIHFQFPKRILLDTSRIMAFSFSLYLLIQKLIQDIQRMHY